MRQTLALCDRAYVLETGKVVREGKGIDLLQDEEVRRRTSGSESEYEGMEAILSATMAEVMRHVSMMFSFLRKVFFLYGLRLRRRVQTSFSRPAPRAKSFFFG